MQTLFSVLDIESTGLSPKYSDKIIEIGITKIDIDGNIIDVYETLINPGRKVAATNIHGITDKMVSDAPGFGEIAGNLLGFINNTVIVAHNVGFDMSFLKSELYQAGYDISDNPRLCTLVIARKLLPFLPSKKLGSLCTHFGIEIGIAHSAFADSLATAQLFTIFMNRYNYREKVGKISLVDYSRRYGVDYSCSGRTVKRSELITK